MKISILSCLFFLFSTVCNASMVRVDFEGYVSDITEYIGEISSDSRGEYNFHGDAIQIGQSTSGFFVFDTGTQPESTFLDDPTINIFSAVKNFRITIGDVEYNLDGWPYNFDPSGYLQVRNDQESTYRDTLSYASPIFYTQPIDLGDGEEIASATISLYDKEGFALDSIDIPPSVMLDVFEYANISLLHFTESDSEFQRKFLFVDSDISSLTYNTINPVPEPTSLTLLLTGFGGLAFLRRREN